jgi:hypothetical protein
VTVCLIIVCAVLVAVVAAAARPLRSSSRRPGRLPEPLAPGPAVPSTDTDDWYSHSCPTLHDMAPEMLVRPYILQRAAHPQDRERRGPGSASPSGEPGAGVTFRADRG